MTVSHFLHSHSCAPRERGWSDNRYLYIIRYRDGNPKPWLKVGRALDPLRRLRELQACTPFWLELVDSWPDMGHCESMLHNALLPFRVDGPSREWYHVSADVVRWLVRGLLPESPDDGSSSSRTLSEAGSPE